MDITELVLQGKIPFTALTDIKKGETVILDLETCTLNVGSEDVKRDVRISEGQADG